MSDAELLVLSFTDHARDPRVHRQLGTLAPRYRVTAAGTADSGIEPTEFVRLEAVPKGPAGKALGAVRLMTRRFDDYYWNTSVIRSSLERLQDLHPKAVLTNDLETLPLALKVAGDAPVIFDAHEYTPREFEDLLRFRLLYSRYLDTLCRSYIPRVRSMTTVCEPIADEYAKLTGVRPEIVWNAPEYADLEPTPPRPDGPIRIVHHGAALRSRRIEEMIKMMQQLDDRFELHLLLVSNDAAYLDELRQLAGDDPRIRFLDPVPMTELPFFLNRFDIGLFLLPPTNFNYRYALPNKFFEFVQARLAVAIGPSPEMARLVEKHSLGWVSGDFTAKSLADTLRSVDADEIATLKANAHTAAPALCAEPGQQTILRLVDEALNGGGS